MARALLQLSRPHDIREVARKDVTEVNVDVLNGKIVSIDHESPKKEAAKKKQDAKEKPKQP